MREGMLWFDNNADKSLYERVERAARHYESKYGYRPNVCYIHPSTLYAEHKPSEIALSVGNVDLRESNSVLPNHFWLGVEDQKRPTAA